MSCHCDDSLNSFILLIQSIPGSLREAELASAQLLGEANGKSITSPTYMHVIVDHGD